MTTAQASEAAQTMNRIACRSNTITCRVIYQKLRSFARLHVPRRSEEYMMYKEGTLQEGVSETAYEASMQHAVYASEFVQNLRLFEKDRRDEGSLLYLNYYAENEERLERDACEWLKDLLLKPEAPSGIIFFDLITYNKNWYIAAESARREINEHEKNRKIALNKIIRLKRKQCIFDNLLRQFPEYKNGDVLIEQEPARVQALDSVRDFSIDYRNVLYNSLLVANGVFEHVECGVIDRLVKSNYAPIVNYEKSISMNHAL